VPKEKKRGKKKRETMLPLEKFLLCSAIGFALVELWLLITLCAYDLPVIKNMTLLSDALYGTAFLIPIAIGFLCFVRVDMEWTKFQFLRWILTMVITLLEFILFLINVSALDPWALPSMFLWLLLCCGWTTCWIVLVLAIIGYHQYTEFPV